MRWSLLHMRRRLLGPASAATRPVQNYQIATPFHPHDSVLARSGRRYVMRPHVINGLPPLLRADRWRSIACGGAHVVVAVQVDNEGECSAFHFSRFSAAASYSFAVGAKVSTSIFGKLGGEDILKQASGLPSSCESSAIEGGRLEIWGWGCNARGQLGPLAPSAAVVAQPQRLHGMPPGACLDSISACCWCEETHFIVDAPAVAGLHHTALFTREVTAAGAPSAHKGMDVVRLQAAPLSVSFSASQVRSCSLTVVQRRQNGGWTKIYRPSATTVQLRATVRVHAACLQWTLPITIFAFAGQCALSFLKSARV
jgi:hypothetical protein